MASEQNGGFIRRHCQNTFKMDDPSYLLCTHFVKYFISELIGTGILVFVGCMGVKSGDATGIGIPLFFGLAAFIGIQIGCHNSGGHINPSVTMCAWVMGKVTTLMALNYLVAQCLGAIFGFRLLMALTPDSSESFCTSQLNSEVTPFQGVVIEFIMTGILSLVICSIWDPNNGGLFDTATLKFGLTISALAFVGGKYTGCSMNPARTLGPAIWYNEWGNHWVYWVGPLLGSAFASSAYRLFFCAAIPNKPKIGNRPNV